ncbi:MAG: ABC transporter ATP-binding protein, partial [Candidatus Omnitrophica bacterium]|nr:ABC transporter ATP-binding protein [Candidatus Omnitrophota bacterium]
MKIIELKNVWEKYRIKFIRARRVYWEDVWALKDINLSLEKGEVLGIIGQNGAGKTTLLKIIAGMFAPDKGEVDIRGKVSTLMELGAGFNPEFTGRQNLIFNSRMYGLDDRTLSRQIDKVIDFASLGKFIDAPVKFYSQGMYTRLAFALAIFVEPDILLIDDILAVGDEEARQKCIDKIFELKQAGKTIIVVSHDLGMVGKLCGRSIILENGRIIQEDSSERIISYYLETVGVKSGIAVLKKDKIKAVFNNGRMAINYNGYPVSKGLGVYGSFFVSHLNEWFSPNSLSWKAKPASPEEVIIEGSAVDGSPAQLWKIKLEDEALSLRIELKEKGEKLHADFILNPDFKKWMTLEEEGEFPAYAYKTKWQDLGLEESPKGIAALIPDKISDKLPGLIFMNQDAGNQLKLFNTGYEQEARVIQPYAKANDLISLNIKFFSGSGGFERYLTGLKQKFLAEKELQSQKNKETVYILESDDIRIQADLRQKFLKLFYCENELTNGSGLHTCFLVNKAWQDSSSAEWQVSKEEGQLSIWLFWKDFDFSENWKFSIRDKKLIWDLKIINNNRQFNPEPVKFGLFLNNKYQKFFCGHQEGDFPAEFKQWQDLPLEKPKAGLFGLRKAPGLPAIFWDNREGLACVIQNSDAGTSSRIIQLSFSKEDRSLNGQEYSFATELTLSGSDNPIDKYIEEEKQRRTLYSTDTKVFVDTENKKIKIFRQNKEITSGRGLYTTVFFAGDTFWFNSFDKDTQWEIEKISPRKLKLRITDKRLVYFSFDWVLMLNADDLLEIKIVAKTVKECSLIYRGLGLEVSDEYKSWKTAYEEGRFSLRDYIHGLAPIRLKNNKVSSLVLARQPESNLPDLSFYVSSQAEKVLLNMSKRLELKDEYLVLSFSTIIPRNEPVMLPGENIFFEADIALGMKLGLEESLK